VAQRKILPLLLCFLLFPVLDMYADRDETLFAFVQYKVQTDTYVDRQKFAQDVGKLVESAVKNGAGVVVFPEYTNVFLATIPLAEELNKIRSLGEGLRILHSYYGPKVGLKEFFLLRSAEVREIMNTVWGELARKHRIWIAAGTAFSPGERGSLRNRLFVYGPDGTVRYTQDKVYLTPFEEEVLRLDPGSLSSAGIVGINGYDCAFTICRDTFFEEWEKKFGQADLWVDLKANGADYDQEAKKIFREALPERISRTEVGTGATVCLTGSFLELFWEGKSSVIRSTDEGEGYTAVAVAKNPEQEQILYILISDSSS